MQPSFTEIIITSTLLFLFGLAVFFQILAPVVKSKPFYRAMAIHLRNGLYVNTISDRNVRALYEQDMQSKPLLITGAKTSKKPGSISVKKYENHPA